MNVKYFRPRRIGPESRLEDILLGGLEELFDDYRAPFWMGGAIPIGAGHPDLVSVWYDPTILSIPSFTAMDGRILAYLRMAKRAKAETISGRLKCSAKSTMAALNQLVEANAVLSNSEIFSVAPIWKQILPKVVTIEAKVTDWKRAVQQAARNRLFANRSYVALPEKVARRVRGEKQFKMLGIGIIAVEESGTVRVERIAPWHNTSIWTYYYELASIAATQMSSTDVIHNNTGRCVPSVS